MDAKGPSIIVAGLLSCRYRFHDIADTGSSQARGGVSSDSSTASGIVAQ